MKCIVVGAGNFVENKINYESDDFVIAADGGLLSLLSIDIVPKVVIGDMDSLNNSELLTKMQEKMVEVIKLPREKDDTDLIAALRIGLCKGYTNFEIYGVLGGRLDHELANIQCLAFLRENGAYGVIKDRNVSLELLINEKRRYEAGIVGTFSAFAFGGDAIGVSEKGFKYEIEDVKLSISYPIGVSNEFIGKESEISVAEGKLLIYKEIY